MAHLMKSNRNQVGGLTRHFQRYKKENGEYIKFGNQDIDTEKSRLNYNLAEEKNQLEFIKERTSEVRCLNRKDVNVMCDWVVTLPEKIKTTDDQELFFQETYNFLEKEYGKENVISSYVHLDETTPHMHFAFVPVVIDKKRGNLKVSAKELITRNHLQEFHPKLENYMEKIFGRNIGVLNEKTKEGNKSIEELKKETAIKELKALQKDLNDFRMNLKVFDVSKDDLCQINQIKGNNVLFQKDKIKLDKNDFKNLVNLAKNGFLEIEKELDPYKEKILFLQDEVEEKRKEVKDLKLDNSNYKDFVNDLELNLAKIKKNLEIKEKEKRRLSKKTKELEKDYRNIVETNLINFNYADELLEENKKLKENLKNYDELELFFQENKYLVIEKEDLEEYISENNLENNFNEFLKEKYGQIYYDYGDEYEL